MYVREANILNLIVFGNIVAKQRNEATEYELDLMNDLQLFNILQLEDDKDTPQRKQGLFERSKNYQRMNQKALQK
jgi:hypothetical protein